MTTSIVNVLALDPGLATFGAVIVQTDGRKHHHAIRADVFTSAPLATEFDLRSCDDRLRRARELDVFLHRFTSGVNINVVVAEAMSFPQGVDPIVAIALAWGVLAAFTSDRGLRVVATMPSHWRTRLIGQPAVRGGSKAQREARTAQRERASHAIVVHRIPSIVPLLRAIKPGLQVHALDAGGVYCATCGDPNVTRLAC